MPGELAAREGDCVGAHAGAGSGQRILDSALKWALLGGAVAGAVVGAALLAPLALPAAAGALIAGTVGGAGGATLSIAGGILSGAAMGIGIQRDEESNRAKLGGGCGKLKDASPNTRIEGRDVARVGDKSGHGDSKMAKGSATVYCNGVPLARLGDKTKCGAKVITSASRTVVGGPPSSGSDSSGGDGDAAHDAFDWGNLDTWDWAGIQTGLSTAGNLLGLGSLGTSVVRGVAGLGGVGATAVFLKSGAGVKMVTRTTAGIGVGAALGHFGAEAGGALGGNLGSMIGGSVTRLVPAGQLISKVGMNGRPAAGCTTPGCGAPAPKVEGPQYLAARMADGKHPREVVEELHADLRRMQANPAVPRSQIVEQKRRVDWVAYRASRMEEMGEVAPLSAATPTNPGVMAHPNQVRLLGAWNQSPQMDELVPEPGFTDVMVHGTPNGGVSIFRRVGSVAHQFTSDRYAIPPGEQVRASSHANGMQFVSPRHLADILTRLGVKGDIRLVSCGTGALDFGTAAKFAEVWNGKVIAPKLTIGTSPTNDGAVHILGHPEGADWRTTNAQYRLFERSANGRVVVSDHESSDLRHEPSADQYPNMRSQPDFAGCPSCQKRSSSAVGIQARAQKLTAQPQEPFSDLEKEGETGSWHIYMRAWDRTKVYKQPAPQRRVEGEERPLTPEEQRMVVRETVHWNNVLSTRAPDLVPPIRMTNFGMIEAPNSSGRSYFTVPESFMDEARTTMSAGTKRLGQIADDEFGHFARSPLGQQGWKLRLDHDVDNWHFDSSGHAINVSPVSLVPPPPAPPPDPVASP